MLVSFLMNGNDCNEQGYAKTTTYSQILHDERYVNRSIDFDSLCNWLDSRDRIADKAYSHYIYGCSFKKYEDCVKTTAKGVSLYGRFISKCAENVDKHYALMLDYDCGNVKHNELHERLVKTGINHYIYTSTGNTETKHKFRVIIPLLDAVEAEEIAKRKDALLKVFPYVDQSCFARIRGFAMPTRLHEDQVITRYKHVSGRDFNVMKLPVNIEQEIKIEDSKTCNDALDATQKDIILRGFSQAFIQKDYNGKFGLVVWAYHHGFSRLEAYELYMSVNASDGVKEHFIKFWDDASNSVCQKTTNGVLRELSDSIRQEFYAYKRLEKRKAPDFLTMLKQKADANKK